ncbi:pyruvate ferredoxin oxidoreductase [candidate division LCP-89 bacterium B3_LCP]|uniref:Pyruvate ferredoxin oxidoreductase n=1 Tax=candidate division LCP-89 bacterium B3_LCP TaxID=2012998 RepID=A0A532UYV3_UNCL8|nr:MAG: pyruvate ferredoxin oxidoreductase [candidate division LCP-89 bacterium B3_LCP]
MVEFRFHSRGGQGGVVAGKLMAVSLFKEGKHVQTFPTFGVERRGAPVMTFVRISDEPIRLRNQVYEPDHIVILDPSLIQHFDVTQGLKKDGIIIINTDKDVSEFNFPSDFHPVAVNAARIAINHKLGSITQPIVNTAILGALAKITGIVSLDSVVAAVKEEAPVKPEANAAAAIEAYNSVEAVAI